MTLNESVLEPGNCQSYCKQQGYVPNKLQRELLVRVYKIEQESGFAIKKDFKELSHRKFYYSVNKLVDKGFLEKASKGVYNLKITSKGKQYLEAIFGVDKINTESVDQIVCHSHSLTFHIEYKNKNATFDDSWKTVSGRSLHWERNKHIRKIGDCIIQVNPNVIVVSFSEIYSPDAHHGVMMGLNRLFSYCRTILSPLDPIIPSVVVVAQHHSLRNGSLAEFTSKYKIFYKSERFTFDRSISAGEFELISPKHSADDCTRLIDLFEAFIWGEITVQDLLDLKKLLPKEQPPAEIVKENVKGSGPEESKNDQAPADHFTTVKQQ